MNKNQLHCHLIIGDNMREMTLALNTPGLDPNVPQKLTLLWVGLTRSSVQKGENNAGRWSTFLLLFSPVLLIVQHCLELKQLIKGS